MENNRTVKKTLYGARKTRVRRARVAGVMIIWSVFAVFCLSLSGCADLRDKFIRKSKQEKTPAKRFYAVRKYDVHPSMDLYTKRYIFWKNWHSELLAVLTDSNHKKGEVAAEQEVSNLEDMRDMLTDEKAAELQLIIGRMSGIEENIKKGEVTAGKEVRVRRELESIGREIKRDFSYTKMKGFIRDDFADR